MVRSPAGCASDAATWFTPLFRLFRLLAYLNYTRRTPLHARSPVIHYSRTRFVNTLAHVKMLKSHGYAPNTPTWLEAKFSRACVSPSPPAFVARPWCAALASAARTSRALGTASLEEATHSTHRLSVVL